MSQTQIFQTSNPQTFNYLVKKNINADLEKLQIWTQFGLWTPLNVKLVDQQGDKRLIFKNFLGIHHNVYTIELL